MRTPLAWKNLTSSLGKCMLASSGVGFAVVLMFMQIGFRNALIDSNAQLFTLFNLEEANVTVVSRARYSLSTEQRFSRPILDKIAALPETARIGIVNLERGTARIRVDRSPSRPVRVVAVDSTALGYFNNPELLDRLLEADSIDACMVDQRSKSFYGFAATDQLLRQQNFELNGKRLNVWGLFRLGTDFANDGTLLMTDRLHADYFPWRWPTRRPGDTVDIALLNVQPSAGESLKDVCFRIRQLAPEQIDVRPSVEVVEDEKEFWNQATPIGKIFLIGTLMGLVVGGIICYQIQFTDISDHMSEFATLRAMGYSNAFFWKFIVQQSIYLACLGFVPGLIVAAVLYNLLASSSGLIMVLTWSRIFQVWGLTLLMCLVSGSLAIRKLFGTDPANLF